MIHRCRNGPRCRLIVAIVIVIVVVFHEEGMNDWIGSAGVRVAHVTMLTALEINKNLAEIGWDSLTVYALHKALRGCVLLLPRAPPRSIPLAVLSHGG